MAWVAYLRRHASPAYPVVVEPLELELRRRTYDRVTMFGYEVLCAIAGVSSFVAFACGELAIAGVLAIASALCYLGAEEADRS